MKRIQIIEDDDAIRAELKTLLRANGYLPVDAPPCDLILMDVMMPVMDGLEATKRIRSLDHPDAGSIPIIAMTANAFEEDVQKTLAAGMNEHLSKPINRKLLVSTLLKYNRHKT